MCSLEVSVEVLGLRSEVRCPIQLHVKILLNPLGLYPLPAAPWVSSPSALPAGASLTRTAHLKTAPAAQSSNQTLCILRVLSLIGRQGRRVSALRWEKVLFFFIFNQFKLYYLLYCYYTQYYSKYKTFLYTKIKSFFLHLFFCHHVTNNNMTFDLI